MSTYSLVVDCINRKNVGDIVTRQDLIDYVSYETGTIDVYRRKLTILGFLSTDGSGNYLILRKIPSFLTSSMLVKKNQDTIKIMISRVMKLNKIINKI